MNHRDKQIIVKILNEINVANDILQDKPFSEFNVNEILKRAICMTLINIGELVKNITEETKLANKQIPWKEIAGFRDVAAHKYQTLRMDDVYYTATVDLPSLKTDIERIINLDITKK
mgnify:CR=1 FL=1